MGARRREPARRRRVTGPRWRLAALALALVALGVCSEAEGRPGRRGEGPAHGVGREEHGSHAPPPAPPPTGRGEARMKRARGRLLREHVGLDDQKARAVEEVLTRSEAARRRHREELRRAERTLDDLLASDSSDEAAYRRAIREGRVAARRLHEVRERELDELGRLLTPRQQARWHQAERRVRERMREGRRRPPPPPP